MRRHGQRIKPLPGCRPRVTLQVRFGSKSGADVQNTSNKSRPGRTGTNPSTLQIRILLISARATARTHAAGHEICGAPNRPEPRARSDNLSTTDTTDGYLTPGPHDHPKLCATLSIKTATPASYSHIVTRQPPSHQSDRWLGHRRNPKSRPDTGISNGENEVSDPEASQTEHEDRREPRIYHSPPL